MPSIADSTNSRWAPTQYHSDRFSPAVCMFSWRSQFKLQKPSSEKSQPGHLHVTGRCPFPELQAPNTRTAREFLWRSLVEKPLGSISKKAKEFQHLLCELSDIHKVDELSLSRATDVWLQSSVTGNLPSPFRSTQSFCRSPLHFSQERCIQLSKGSEGGMQHHTNIATSWPTEVWVGEEGILQLASPLGDSCVSRPSKGL